MTNKERYIEWAGKQEYLPVFMHPWWLDAVCAGKEWDVLIAEDAEGQIKGVIRDVNGNEQYVLGGNWLENLYVINSKTNEKSVLWNIIPSLNKI